MIDSCDGEFESLMGLTSDMEALLKSNSGDIAIVCGGKQIKVHSFLLGARCDNKAVICHTHSHSHHSTFPTQVASFCQNVGVRDEGAAGQSRGAQG